MNKAKIEKMAHEARAKAGQAGARSSTVQPKPAAVQPKSATATPKSATASAIASDARETAQERETREAVNLSRETINALADAVAGAIVTRLEVLLPICARLAAVDTIHTVQKPETVLGDAIKEGLLAGGLIWEKKQ